MPNNPIAKKISVVIVLSNSSSKRLWAQDSRIESIQSCAVHCSRCGPEDHCFLGSVFLFGVFFAFLMLDSHLLDLDL